MNSSRCLSAFFCQLLPIYQGREAYRNGLSIGSSNSKRTHFISARRDIFPETFKKRGKSEKPRIAIIDNFVMPRIDVNGDGKKNISHGGMVANVLKNSLDCQLIKFSDSKEIVPSRIIIKKVPEILEEHSRNPISAVNISFGLVTSMRILGKKIGFEKLSAHNIHLHKEKIRSYYLRTNELQQGEVIRSLELLSESGVKVFVAGGNSGPNYTNVFGVARGIISIGSVNAKGAIVPRSAENSLLRYARGVYDVFKTAEGYGFFSRGKTDFKMNLPLLKTYPEKFIGRQIKDVVSFLDEDYEMKKKWMETPGKYKIEKKSHLYQKIYSINKLYRIGALSSKELKILQDNDFQFVSFDDRFYFRGDKNGLVVYDPDGSGRSGSVYQISGTSFATPQAIADSICRENSFHCLS